MEQAMQIRWPVVCAGLSIAMLTTSVAGQAVDQGGNFDVILRGGTIIDGTGSVRYDADVAIRNGRIIQIGPLAGARADIELDVAGLFVTPGFINLHSHASVRALPAAENMLTQGVTTEVVNADGSGATDIPAQLERVASSGLAVNVGAYIGFNSIWRTVVGPDNRRATDAEIARMRDVVTAGLEGGAWGVSAGLDYTPAYYATTDEVVSVVEAAKPWRTHFTNHGRITPESNFSSLVGMEETIAIGERAGLAPLITHMKVQGHEQGSAARVVELMREATGRGHYAAADLYPYLAGQTGLGALIIPAWAQDGGNDAMRDRFADPALRSRIVEEAEAVMAARFGGPQGVYLPATGRELVDVMEELQVSAGEAVVRLLEAGGAGAAILRFGDERDLMTLLQNPDAAVACDCGATTSTRTHPRNYGTYPRVLGRYVRERGVLTWEDAIRKMAGLPASLVGMVDRGFLAPGMAADITVFDPLTIIDHATYQDPARLSVGVRHVLVAGRLALRDGTVTGVQAGTTLTRTIDMPTRPMSSSSVREVSTPGMVDVVPADSTGNMSSARMSFDVRQGSHERRATGTFRLQDGSTEVLMESLGLLQLAPGWATFSGVGRVGAEERAIIVVLDEGLPGATVASVSIHMDNAYTFTGTLPLGVIRLGGIASERR